MEVIIWFYFIKVITSYKVLCWCRSVVTTALRYACYHSSVTPNVKPKALQLSEVAVSGQIVRPCRKRLSHLTRTVLNTWSGGSPMGPFIRTHTFQLYSKHVLKHIKKKQYSQLAPNAIVNKLCLSFYSRILCYVAYILCKWSFQTSVKTGRQEDNLENPFWLLAIKQYVHQVFTTPDVLPELNYTTICEHRYERGWWHNYFHL